MNLLNISGSPHVHSDESTKKIMWRVNLALVPALIVATLFFGVNALLVSLISVVSCVLFQWLIEKFILKTPTTVWAFNVPSTVDMMWIVVIGALVAIGVAKMSFGGLGKNPFNPAIVGRIFLLISFPVQMTTWPVVDGIFPTTFDVATGATPLGAFKEGALPADVTFMDAFMGHIGGSMGEVSALAILLGAAYLCWRKIISWHIPVTFIGTAFVFSGILWLINPETYMDPLMTILTGGIMLGACFMATDMVTSPMAKSGQLIFGFGCGLLTIVIRNWGSYPEGVSFAILIMNCVTPLLNRWCKPQRFAC